jgi:translation initiation factor 1
MSANTRLVYSTDPKDNQKCPKCKELLKECRCEPEMEYSVASGAKFVAVVRIEKGGRGGKTVTVIDRLPKQEIFLKEITRDLKKSCGTGGTYSTEGKDGMVEIQGDKRKEIRVFFEKHGYKIKGDFGG